MRNTATALQGAPGAAAAERLLRTVVDRATTAELRAEVRAGGSPPLFAFPCLCTPLPTPPFAPAASLALPPTPVTPTPCACLLSVFAPCSPRALASSLPRFLAPLAGAFIVSAMTASLLPCPRRFLAPPRQVESLGFAEYAERNFNLDRKGFFGKRSTVDKVGAWKDGKEVIKTALCRLGDKELVHEAVQSYRNITGYMGDRPSGKNPNDHAYKILAAALAATDVLRNEIYCQAGVAIFLLSLSKVACSFLFAEATNGEMSTVC